MIPILFTVMQRFALAAALLLVFVACQPLIQPPANPGPSVTQTVRYTLSPENFPNPERGFHRNIDLVFDRDLAWVYANGFTLVRSYIRLDDYREQPLPDTLLADLQAGFAAARAAGIKVIPRFSYNFPETLQFRTAPDAALPVVLQHIEQLTPLLQENADVIALMQAGFVGAWGEWHSSASRLDEAPAKQQIFDALLAALPPQRMVQLRYPGDLLEFFPTPLRAAEAFSGSPQARMAHHNDCFLANAHDAGTYLPDKRKFQKYLDAMTPFVAIGGETCQVAEANRQLDRADCATALAEMARFHWSYLNYDFYEPTITRWQQEGCYDEVSHRLGYRLALLEATVPRHAPAGGELALRFVITNRGWASPYNPRPLELILRHQQSGAQIHLPLPHDPRFWLAGETQTIAVATGLPADAAKGLYDLLLHLPDAQPLLNGRPAYSIRLANEDLWEADTGYNRLLLTITIE